MKSEAIFLVKKGDAKHAFLKKEITLPALNKGEAMIKSEAFGLNYADVMARNGLYREAPPMPCVIGYEVVGEVLSVGPDGNHDLINFFFNFFFNKFNNFIYNVVASNFIMRDSR